MFIQHGIGRYWFLPLSLISAPCYPSLPIPSHSLNLILPWAYFILSNSASSISPYRLHLHLQSPERTHIHEQLAFIPPYYFMSSFYPHPPFVSLCYRFLPHPLSPNSGFLRSPPTFFTPLLNTIQRHGLTSILSSLPLPIHSKFLSLSLRVVRAHLLRRGQLLWQRGDLKFFRSVSKTGNVKVKREKVGSGDLLGDDVAITRDC